MAVAQSQSLELRNLQSIRNVKQSHLQIDVIHMQTPCSEHSGFQVTSAVSQQHSAELPCCRCLRLVHLRKCSYQNAAAQ